MRDLWAATFSRLVRSGGLDQGGQTDGGMLMSRGWSSTDCRIGRLLARVLTRATVVAALTAAAAASVGVASAESGGFSGRHIGQLAGVSCSSADACIAVGSYVPGFDHPEPAVALAYRWNGKRWSRQHSPTGSGAALRAVSCPSAKSCLAVGSAGGQELVERWNGEGWTRQSPPNPASGDLSAVSCSSTNACTAVGSANGSAWAGSWNGSTWTSQSISTLSGSYLDGVNCPSANVCFAVGAKSNGPNAAVLVERWNGSAWSEQNAPSPSPRSGGPHLTSVSCATVRSCTAVGSGGYGVLVEHWNGSRWTRQTAPRSHVNAVLASVSCPSAERCTAVGENNFARGGKALGVLVESWNGKKWSLTKAPNPVFSRGSAALLSVACSSAKSCIAVGAGGDFSDNVEKLIAERWNGRRWHLQ